MNTTRVRAFLATSVDGHMAGPQDEIEWLQAPRVSGKPVASGAWAKRASDGLEFDDFLADIGSMLMGRRTYDVQAALEIPWLYGERPVIVATTRDLVGAPDTALAASAPIADLVAMARDRAGGKDVYVDGGQVVRSTLEEGLLDELIVTILPTVLGDGLPLFVSSLTRIDLTISDVRKWGDGFVQVHYSTRG